MDEEEKEVEDEVETEDEVEEEVQGDAPGGNTAGGVPERVVVPTTTGTVKEVNEVGTVVSTEEGGHGASSCSSTLSGSTTAVTVDAYKMMQRSKLTQAVRVVFQHVQFLSKAEKYEGSQGRFSTWVMDLAGVEDEMRGVWWKDWGDTARRNFKKKRNNVQSEIKRKMIGESK